MSDIVFSINLIEEKDYIWFNKCRNLVRKYLHNNEYFTVEQTFYFMQQNKKNYWIVRLNDKRIGYIRSILDETKRSIMIGLDIHPEDQGKKYAKQIYMQFISKMYEEHGIYDYTLRVLKSNKKAINLYLTFGFETAEETDLDFMMNYRYKMESNAK